MSDFQPESNLYSSDQHVNIYKTTGALTDSPDAQVDSSQPLNRLFVISLCYFVLFVIIGYMLVDHDIFTQYRNLLGGFFLGVGLKGIVYLLERLQANTLLGEGPTL